MMCYDVCSFGTCGDDSQCRPSSHRPVCVCPYGTTGDPQTGCTAMSTAKPTTVPSPVTEETVVSDVPIFPHPGSSSAAPPPIAEFPTPRPTQPPPPRPSTVIPLSPEPIGCETTTQCPKDNSCINDLCVDVCHFTSCGDNADCQTVNHTPKCTCPPHTTGNPTDKCIALAIDIPTTLRPVIDEPDFDDEPIVAGQGKTTPRPPPFAETPTTRKPVPTSPRPPPPPLKPPVPIACKNNDDCTVDNSCINRLCYDVCSLGICGTHADCKIQNHRPVCSCPPGTEGDPTSQCLATATERPTTPMPPIPGDSPTPPLDPVRPVADPTSPGPPPIAEYPTPRPPQPPVTQPPIPPTPGPLPIGCLASDDCSFDNSCVNKLCLDVCHPGYCGENADCQTIGHRPHCTCPAGTTGNPTIKCSAMAVETPTTPHPPIAGDTPSVADPPIQPIPGTTTPRSPPEGEPATRPPHQPHTPRPPPSPVIPSLAAACENNDDCDSEMSCINMMCYDVCSFGTCGDDSQCIKIDHSPVCVCPYGTTGDPQVKCTSLTTSRPEVISPVTELTSTSDEPIVFGHGPSTTAPPPIGIRPTPRPTDPPVTMPTLVPTPPPEPVGCATNDECPLENTCVNSLCFDICHPGLCGFDADCQTVGNRPACICPPGTTGNPTEKCIAIATEFPPTSPSPVAQTTQRPPDQPIVAGMASSTHPPPLVEEPTTRPPEIPPPRPEIPPVTAPVIIACQNNDECPVDNSCLNHKCYDVCALGICGEDADCKIDAHRPVCSCPPGTTGVPTVECHALLVDTTTPVIPLKDTPPPTPQDPLIPVSPPPSTTPPPTAVFPTPRPSPPPVPRPPPPPTVPPQPVGCESSSDCPFDNSCVNRLCMDICYPGLCGENAECSTEDHKVVCSCPPGTSGNPTLKCSALAVFIPPPPLPPLPEDTPVPDDKPLQPVSPPPSTTPPPAAEMPTVRPPLITTIRPLPPIMPTIPIACENNDDCDIDNSCINLLCYEACALGICGENAECKTVEHRPVCICPPGTTGDPQRGCSAVLSDIPTPPPPPVGVTTEHPHHPIFPISGSTTPMPPPIIETVLPQVKEPHPPSPPPPVTSHPLPAGCTTSTQCSFDEKCYNSLCVKACSLSPCDKDPNCYAQMHEAVCTPVPIAEQPECVIDQDCFTTQMCTSNVCRDVCIVSNPCAPMAVCTGDKHRPQCNCPPGYIGNPFVSCRLPEPPAPPPKPTPRPECLVDNDCDYHLACLNQRCLDPCLKQVCGLNANCRVTIHTPRCHCLPGHFGNPFVECREPSTPTTPLPDLRPQCTVNADCRYEHACYNNDCKNPCVVTNPCAPTAVCDVVQHQAVCSCLPPLSGNPYHQCITIEVTTPKPECVVDGDCSDKQACIQQQCKDPCALYDNCAPNAECHVTQHRAICSCPDGYIGNPYVQCLVAGCRANSECPPKEACINQECQDPCDYENCGINAECRVVNQRAKCFCPDRFLGDPYERCERPECDVDSECPSWLACIRQECQDPCNCGSQAECRVINHRPVCTCPPGYEGDANIACTPKPERVPPVQCTTDGECPSKLACFSGHCENPCQIIQPCGVNAKCSVIDTLPYRTMICECLPGFTGDAYKECVPRPTELPGCTTDSECPPTEVCRNRQCLDPCALLDPCAPNAECQVINRRHTCTCPPDHTGNPHVSCYKILEEPECRTDSDCPYTEACINEECADPCLVEDPCGKEALCRTQQHRPICYCPDGWAGNPQIECSKPPVCPFEKGFILTDDDRCVCPTERSFYVDENGNCQRCLVELGFILTDDGRCICDPDKGYVLTAGGICDCPLPGVKNEDGKCVVHTEPPPPIGCTSDDDCPNDKACEQRKCVYPCDYYPCAKLAKCINRDHRANCTCIAGYSGDPYKEDGCKDKIGRTDFPRPEMVVNCLADGVQVDINIGDPGFNGVMYVKGYSKNEECRRVMRPDIDTGTIDFKVKFNTCGLIHENGLARFILVLQKHPKLVTYNTQAYHVKCTYNTGEKTITIGFNVSMLTTAGTIANTGPPPTCLMKITDPNGDSIEKAEIGDLLMLRVMVEPSNIYGGFARNCIALTANPDGTDNEHLVTDENGCATDPSIFGEWEQDDDDAKTLVALFSAFKFPSSNSIRFQCNVRVCFGRCHPVNCNGYDAFGRRRRREANSDAEVLYQPESVYDGQLREIEVYSQSIFTVETRTERFTAPQEEVISPEEVCVSKWGFIIALIITALLALVAVAVAVSCWLMAYRRRPKHGGPLPHPPEFPNPLFTTPEPLAEPSPDYLS